MPVIRRKNSFLVRILTVVFVAALIFLIVVLGSSYFDLDRLNFKLSYSTEKHTSSSAEPAADLLNPLPDTLGCHKNIEVRMDKGIETVAIVFNLTGISIPVGLPNDHPYRKETNDKFTDYQQHDAVETARDLLKNGFWLDAMNMIPIYCTPFPSAGLVLDPGDGYYIRASGGKGVAEGRELVGRFIDALNRFYVDAEVEKYLAANDSIYQGVLAEVRKNLPDNKLICIMERYYRKENLSYTLVPSPLLPFSNGFGPRLQTENGQKVFNIFGPQVSARNKAEFRFGYDSPGSINELCVHEFGHSFVNPCTETEENRAIIEKYSYLFEAVRKVMKKQGYPGWWTCVTEHIVRLGEIRIAYALGDPERAGRLRDRYVKGRKFIYLPALEEKIREYESNRDRYPSFDDFVPELLETFGRIEKPGWFDIIKDRLFGRPIYN